MASRLSANSIIALSCLLYNRASWGLRHEGNKQLVRRLVVYTSMSDRYANKPRVNILVQDQYNAHRSSSHKGVQSHAHHATAPEKSHAALLNGRSLVAILIVIAPLLAFFLLPPIEPNKQRRSEKWNESKTEGVKTCLSKKQCIEHMTLENIYIPTTLTSPNHSDHFNRRRQRVCQPRQ